MDQEYTISYDDNISVLPVSIKEDKLPDNTIISDDSVIEKEENSEILSNENKEEKVINSDSSLLTENEEKTSDEEISKINEVAKEDNSILSKDINNENSQIQNATVNLKNGFYDEDGSTYYYENDIKVTGLKNIDGVSHYFSSSGKHLGTNNIKVIDVSYYQKDINWDLFASDSDCYGVILRLGYYETLDKKFERNISELKRLNIPYGIYLFSYASTLNGAKKKLILLII